MNNDLSSYFEDPEFKDILAKYEGMVESHTPTYFEADELADLADYFIHIGDEEESDKVIMRPKEEKILEKLDIKR